MIYKTAVVASLLAATGRADNLDSFDFSTEADRQQEIADADISRFFIDIQSAEHPAKILKTNKAQKKWVKFPEQHAAHVTAIESKSRGLRAAPPRSRVLAHEDFFTTHAATFGLTSHTEMKISKTTNVPNTHTVRHRYDQYYHGVKVLTGDYAVTVGAHKGVLHAHGLSFSGESLRQNNAQVAKIKAKQVDTQSIHSKVKATILERALKPVKTMDVPEQHFKDRTIKPTKITLSKKTIDENKLYADLSENDILLQDVEIELVVHPQWLGRGLSDSSLAYHVQGTARVRRTVVPFNACLDAETLEPRIFVDKTDKFTIGYGSSTVNLYESDAEDDLGNLHWTNAAPYNLHDTGSSIGDLMVVTTMQTRNLLYALSGGLYESWAGTNVDLDIVRVSDNSFVNAYFYDSKIWFGPGFETDDVVAHEWAHGYVFLYVRH